MKKRFSIYARYRSFLWPVLIAVAIFWSFIFVLNPRINDVVVGKRTLSSKREELTETTRKLAALEGLNEYELSNKTNRTLNVLPVEKNIPLFIATIRSLARLVEIDLVELVVDPGSVSTAVESSEMGKKKDIPSLDFDISLAGPAKSIEEFIRLSKTTAPLIKIKSVTISHQKEPPSAKLVVGVYYLPLPETMGSFQKSLPTISDEEKRLYESLSKMEPLSIGEELVPVVSGRENPFTF